MWELSPASLPWFLHGWRCSLLGTSPAPHPAPASSSGEPATRPAERDRITALQVWIKTTCSLLCQRRTKLCQVMKQIAPTAPVILVLLGLVWAGDAGWRKNSQLREERTGRQLLLTFPIDRERARAPAGNTGQGRKGALLFDWGLWGVKCPCARGFSSSPL